MQKDIKNGNCTNKKKSKSNHSGIGRAFFLKNYDQILRLGFIPFNGKKTPLPRYFERLAHKHYCHFYDKGAFFEQNLPSLSKCVTPFSQHSSASFWQSKQKKSIDIGVT